MCSRGEVTTHEDGRLPGPVDCMQLKSSTPTRMAALPGFSALVAAEAFGLARNTAVATKGDVVRDPSRNESGGGVAARDRNGDSHLNIKERFDDQSTHRDVIKTGWRVRIMKESKWDL